MGDENGKDDGDWQTGQSAPSQSSQLHRPRISSSCPPFWLCAGCWRRITRHWRPTDVAVAARAPSTIHRAAWVAARHDLDRRVIDVVEEEAWAKPSILSRRYRWFPRFHVVAYLSSA